MLVTCSAILTAVTGAANLKFLSATAEAPRRPMALAGEEETEEKYHGS
jgi:hypothetical protein